MSSWNTVVYGIGFSVLLAAWSSTSLAQADQYKRAKPAAKTEEVKPVDGKAADAKPADAKKADGKVDPKSATTKAATPTDDKSDKLDISDLEQKYWAPKDTDFSVVQNRTYTKAGRFSLSAMTGPIVNDNFSEGFNNTLKANYYLDERYGVEAMYIKSELSDTDSISNFRSLSGGSTNPDYNREDSYIGIGFNWVPIYAKVSLLGSRILYFDLQVTPHVGTSSYIQQTDGNPVASGQKKSAFTYGLDITQFYFLSKELALRFDLHNRWYRQEVVAWSTGVKRDDKNQTTQMFLFGVTYFF